MHTAMCFLNVQYVVHKQCVVHKTTMRSTYKRNCTTITLHYTTKFSLFMIPTVPPSPLIQDARDIPGGIHKSLKNQHFQ